MTDQEQIILYQIVLEVLVRKRSVSHALNELMLGILLPWLLDIPTLEQILDEPTSTGSQFEVLQLARHSLRAKWQGIRRMEVVDRTISFAEVATSLNAHLYVEVCSLDGVDDIHARSEVACNCS